MMRLSRNGLGPPSELVLGLQARYGIRSFVETGTFRGDTAAWAAEHFPSMFTIEASAEFYPQARQRLTASPNVEALLGDSRRMLPSVGPSLQSSVLFWLDAHWSGGATFGVADECPLLEELEIISGLARDWREDLFVLIDDARLFVSPPPLPHRAEQWPELKTVLDACAGCFNDPYIVVIDDVIVCVPRRARAYVQDYCQRVNTELWKQETTAHRGALLPRVAARVRTEIGRLVRVAEREARKYSRGPGER